MCVCVRVYVFVYVCVCVCVCVCVQGLWPQLQQRIPSWQFSAPCKARLCLPVDPPLTTLQQGITAALTQLSPLLLPGSSVQLYWECEGQHWFDEDDDGEPDYLHRAGDQIAVLGGIAAAVAAAAPSLQPDVTVILPAQASDDAGVATLCAVAAGAGAQHAYAAPAEPVHVCFEGLGRLTGAHAGVAWPWGSLWVKQRVFIDQLLRLPDPTAGQYDVHLSGLYMQVNEVGATTHGSTHNHTICSTRWHLCTHMCVHLCYEALPLVDCMQILQFCSQLHASACALLTYEHAQD